jgi:heme-degrading monooxygenase HmoA
MIVRIWEGKVPIEKAEAYGRYLAGFGVQDYQRVTGNLGVSLLRRDEAGETHFFLLSYWTSREVLEAYAGPNVDQAHYYTYDLECLIEPSPTVRHYEVVVSTTDERGLMNQMGVRGP